MAQSRRRPREWDPLERPTLLAVTGYRDQRHRVTYIPWSDVSLGLFGWEVFPDVGNGQQLLVYLYPTEVEGQIEIRCHQTDQLPDPSVDQLLGKITLPPWSDQ